MTCRLTQRTVSEVVCYFYRYSFRAIPFDSVSKDNKSKALKFLLLLLFAAEVGRALAQPTAVTEGIFQ